MKPNFIKTMNLLEYKIWQRTKILFIFLFPLIVVFLFINSYISLVLFFIVLGRLLVVVKLKSDFEKATEDSSVEHDRLIGGFEKNIKNIKSKLAKTELDEILALTDNFDGVHIDFIEATNEYIVVYGKQRAYFSDYRKIREWLNSIV